MTTIRRATAEDVTGIGAVIEDAFAQLIDEPYCQQLIQQGEQQIHVAIADDDRVIGFVSGFLTTAQGGIRRWEIDLLAVHTNFQKQDIGQNLVKAAWQDAEAHNVRFARAAVRIENTAAQRTFQKAGYTSNERIYNMIYWTPLVSQAVIAGRSPVNAIPVKTLTYQGIWLEGLDIPMLSDADRIRYIEGARAAVARESYQFASSLLPPELSMKPEIPGDGQIVGQYQWWHKP